MLFPSLVAFAQSYWSGCAEERPEFRFRMPAPEDPAFARVVDLERRLIAQRDKVLTDFRYPFQVLRQTDLRWRITDADTGDVIATDVAQGSVWISHKDAKQNAFVTNRFGNVNMETWIYSPKEQQVGAWIDCLGLNGVYGRLSIPSIPEKGQWNTLGARVFLNEEEIPAPNWQSAGAKSKTKPVREQDVPYSTDLLETPLTDEIFTLRPPQPITLKEGWNHVKLALPKPKDKWANMWMGLFVPVLGTSEHPREVPDLVYRSSEP